LLPHTNCVHFYQSWEEDGRLYQVGLTVAFWYRKTLIVSYETVLAKIILVQNLVDKVTTLEGNQTLIIEAD